MSASPTRVTKVAVLFAAAGLMSSTCASAQSSAQQSDSADRAIFVDHDEDGRLANSEITRIGELRSGSHRLTIYTLWFVNPVSRHGIKHLAIVEGGRFVGSYIISWDMIPKLVGDRVRFSCGSQGEASLGEDLAIKDGILPPKLWACGDISDLGDTI